MSSRNSGMIDSLTVVVAGGAARFEPTIYIDGSALSLTGRTVTATIRALRAPDNILSSSYEDMSVTLGNDDVTAANGGTRLDITLNATYFHTPQRAEEWEDYFIQYHVQPDNYYPQALRFGVRRGID